MEIIIIIIFFEQGSWKLLVLLLSPIRTQNSHGVFGKREEHGAEWIKRYQSI